MNKESTLYKVIEYIRDSLMTVLFGLVTWLSFYNFRYIILACAITLAVYLLLCVAIQDTILPNRISKVSVILLSALFVLTEFTTITNSFWGELMMEYAYYVVNMIIPITITVLFMARPVTLTVFFKQLKVLSIPLIAYAFYEEITKTNVFMNYYPKSYRDALTSQGRVLSVFMHAIVCAFFFSSMFIMGFFVKFRFKICNILYEILTFTCVLMTRSRTSLVALGVVGGFAFLHFIVFGIRKRIDRRKNTAEAANTGGTDSKKSTLSTDSADNTQNADNTKTIAGAQVKTAKKKHSAALAALPYVSAAAILGGAFYLFWDKIVQFVSEYYDRIIEGATGSDQGIRIEVIKNYFMFWEGTGWKNRLIGYGSRVADVSWMKAYPALGWWDSTTDNMYITLLIDVGVIGTALFLMLALFAVIMLFIRKNHMNETEGCLKQGSWAELGAYLVIYTAANLFFYEGLYWPVVVFIFMTALFMIRPVRTKRKAEENK